MTESKCNTQCARDVAVLELYINQTVSSLPVPCQSIAFSFPHQDNSSIDMLWLVNWNVIYWFLLILVLIEVFLAFHLKLLELIYYQF